MRVVYSFEALLFMHETSWRFFKWFKDIVHYRSKNIQIPLNVSNVSYSHSCKS